MNAFLCSDSRCLTAGKSLAKMLKKDYAGNATEGKNYIGAFCKTK